jgi:hypothetical protein
MMLRFTAIVATVTLTTTATVSGAQAQAAYEGGEQADASHAGSSSSEAAFSTVPVAEDALQAIAGRQDLSLIAEAENTASVTDNSVGDNSSTGEVRVADNAFQNLSGLSLLNINTGNNVAINASMNVNIAINPPQP